MCLSATLQVPTIPIKGEPLTHSSHFTNPHHFLYCIDETHQKSQNSMNSVRVGHCLMVALKMLRYHMKHCGYSISFVAHQYSCSDPHG